MEIAILDAAFTQPLHDHPGLRPHAGDVDRLVPVGDDFLDPVIEAQRIGLALLGQLLLVRLDLGRADLASAKQAAQLVRAHGIHRQHRGFDQPVQPAIGLGPALVEVIAGMGQFVNALGRQHAEHVAIARGLVIGRGDVEAVQLGVLGTLAFLGPFVEEGILARSAAWARRRNAQQPWPG